MTFMVIWLLALALVISHSKLSQMEWINTHNNPFADRFFWWATKLGEGGFFVMVILVACLIKVEFAVMFTASFAISTLISQGLKFLFHTNRPLAFFEKINHPWHFVDGVNVHVANSFPSGHTTTAFAICSLIAFLCQNKKISPLWVLIASLTGYSRNYLFQHFPEDVLAGAVIGLISSYWAYNWIKANPKTIYQTSILRIK